MHSPHPIPTLAVAAQHSEPFNNDQAVQCRSEQPMLAVKRGNHRDPVAAWVVAKCHRRRQGPEWLEQMQYSVSRGSA